MPTLKDVAALAGVSAATVSLYLNGKSAGRISQQKQKEIEEALKQLSYLQATKRAGHFPPYIHSCCILGS